MLLRNRVSGAILLLQLFAGDDEDLLANLEQLLMPKSDVEAAGPQPRIHTRGVGEKDRLMSTSVEHRFDIAMVLALFVRWGFFSRMPTASEIRNV